MSETTLLVGNFRGMKVKPGSMGKPGPGYKVDIVDDQGKRNMPILEVFKICCYFFNNLLSDIPF